MTEAAKPDLDAPTEPEEPQREGRSTGLEAFGPSDSGYREYEIARSGSEAAEVLLANVDSLRYSDGAAAAVLLLEDALRWVARSHFARAGRSEPDFDPRDATAVADALPSDLAPHAPVVAEAFGRAGGVAYRDAANLEVQTRLDRLTALRGACEALLRPLDRDATALVRVRLRRFALIAGIAIAVVVAAAIAVGKVRSWRRGPDLALHKPVATSSTLPGYGAGPGAVDGIVDALGFHTQVESEPWVRIDLGASQRVGEVVVYNRTDCCGDRALPLVVETSTDGSTFAEVSRRESGFDVWDARFGPVEARYVRLRTLARNPLHLNEVEVYRGH